MERAGPDLLSRLRTMLLGLLGLGLAGTATELLLIGHYEDAWQMAPLAVIGLAFACTVWRAWARPGGIALFRGVMLGLIACGLAGTALHHHGAREFQIELDPALGGLALLSKALHAKTPPALAPGNLVFFGLLGLASTYKEPVTAAPASPPTTGD